MLNMADNFIVLTSDSSSESNDNELLKSFARGLQKHRSSNESNPCPGTPSIANPDYFESAHLWFYPLYSRRVESGESVT
jgi:hypothetical protein